MNKVTINEDGYEKLISMKEMPLGSIGRIVDAGAHNGHIVRRTVSSRFPCVEDLSKPRRDGCWTPALPDTTPALPDTLYVQLLPDAELVVNIK